jgi:hypothetical protein
MDITNSTWFRPSITDYWDWRGAAVESHVQKLAALAPAAREQALGEIRDCIAAHAAALSDDLLLKAAVCMSDDLYKTAVGTEQIVRGPRVRVWDENDRSYLAASAATLGSLVAARGYVIRYVIDNSFEISEDGLAGPIEYFRVWFSAAGFVYICPQALATELMKADSQKPEDLVGLLPQYAAEARYLANSVAGRCQQEHRHYVFLDADSVDGAFEAALAKPEGEGVLQIFRNEAPIPGSCCEIVFPQAPRTR